MNKPAGARSSDLELVTSDRALSTAFEWAKNQALAYVSPSGDPVGAWYEAALPHREAFCMRDVSHQAMGAHALGLDRETRNMLQKFGGNISDSKDWCTYWEINRYNRPAPIDYRNDNDFWYNLPANFDVLDACFRMYQWSGDKTLLNDPALVNFYRRTVDDYVVRWDLGLDRILERPRIMNLHGDSGQRQFQRSRGIPSYDEARNGFICGADLVAAQAAAYESYARMNLIKGDQAVAKRFMALGERTRAFLNHEWWDDSQGDYHSFALPDHRFAEGWLGSYVLYFGATEGDHAASAMNALVRRQAEKPANIEAQSHYPEILYRYGRPDDAYAQILDLARSGKPRREYPEVSYAVIGAIVNGLMGIDVDPTRVQRDVAWRPALDGIILTLPRLTHETESAELKNLPVRKNRISVRHDGLTKTALTNVSGPPILWRACLPSRTAVTVNGRVRDASRSTAVWSGRMISCMDVKVRAGMTATVAATASRRGRQLPRHPLVLCPSHMVEWAEMSKTVIGILGGASAAIVGLYAMWRSRPAPAEFAYAGPQHPLFDIDDDRAADIIRQMRPAIEQAVRTAD